jgi:hypothetical protein
MCGHNHHYERGYPMINSSSLDYEDSELYDYTNLNNSIYIVTGGAGAPLYPVYDPAYYPFIAYNNETYHFVIVDINEGITETTLSLEAWGMPNDFNGLYLFDNITITKSN